MLKITVSETATEDRWILQGRLVGPWVGELKKVWQNAHRGGKQPRCVFDLNDVTFVDKAGERLLRALAKQGRKVHRLRRLHTSVPRVRNLSHRGPSKQMEKLRRDECKLVRVEGFAATALIDELSRTG